MEDRWEIQHFYLKSVTDLKISKEAKPLGLYEYRSRLRFFVLEKKGLVTFNTRRFLVIPEGYTNIPGDLKFILSILSVAAAGVVFLFEDVTNTDLSQITRIKTGETVGDDTAEKITVRAQEMARSIGKDYDKLPQRDQAQFWKAAHSEIEKEMVDNQKSRERSLRREED